MTDSALSLLGLALRGNHLAVGEQPASDACKAGRAKLVLTAADAAENSAQRAARWADAENVPWTQVPWTKEALGAALGRNTCAMAALTDAGLAAALAKKLAQSDPQYQPLCDKLAVEKPQRPQTKRKKKNVRAETKRPAVPET